MKIKTTPVYFTRDLADLRELDLRYRKEVEEEIEKISAEMENIKPQKKGEFWLEPHRINSDRINIDLAKVNEGCKKMLLSLAIERNEENTTDFYPTT